MKRYNHDLSFQHSLSLDMGYLVPIACIDVLPGDTFRHAAAALARVAPMAKPVMHDVDISIHNWYVPNRIVYEDWEEFVVGNEAAVTYPTLSAANATEAALLDHMGIEPITGVSVDALPVRAYNLIWNEFYRDQDLSTARTISLASGADATTELGLARVAWQKDYFTTARANPQQGTAVDVSFASGSAPITGFGAEDVGPLAGPIAARETDKTATVNYANYWSVDSAATAGLIEADPNNAGYPNIRADLSQATGGIDINDLRNAISLQRIAEAREFYGSRYVDFLRWYGVNPSDGRLDRPEFLGGGRQKISFSEVLATAETGTSVDVGDMYGHGIAGVRQRPFRKMFEEHGWFISVMFVRPKGVYQNGIPKRFLRTDPTDWWHRELELMPWQTVDQLEIFGAGTPGTVFGYVPRFDEYRETSSYVSGTFRGGTEEDWTLAREFAVAPTLNETFITCTPSDRIYQDTSMPEILATVQHSIKAKRLVARNARMSNRAGI